MPLGAGDVISGILEGVAKGVAATAGKTAIEQTKGAVQTEALTDEEFEEAKRIRDAQARKAAK